MEPARIRPKTDNEYEHLDVLILCDSVSKSRRIRYVATRNGQISSPPAYYIRSSGSKAQNRLHDYVFAYDKTDHLTDPNMAFPFIAEAILTTVPRNMDFIPEYGRLHAGDSSIRSHNVQCYDS